MFVCLFFNLGLFGPSGLLQGRERKLDPFQDQIRVGEPPRKKQAKGHEYRGLNSGLRDAGPDAIGVC